MDEQKLNKTFTQNRDEDDKNKKNSDWYIRVLFLLTISTAILAFVVGITTDFNNRIDTINVGPSEAYEIPLPLNMLGNVYYDLDKTPFIDGNVDLDSPFRFSKLNNVGSFFFDNIVLSQFLTIVKDLQGNVLEDVPISLSKKNGMVGFSVTGNQQDGYVFEFANDIIYFEVDIYLDGSNGWKLRPEHFGAVNSKGEYFIKDHSINNEGIVIVTPNKSTILGDDTIVVPGKGLIFPDGTFVSQEDLTITPPFGEATDDIHPNLPKDVTFTEDGDDIIITTPDGTIIVWGKDDGDTTVKLEDGTTVDKNGDVTEPDGTKKENEDGLIIDPDGPHDIPEWLEKDPTPTLRPTLRPTQSPTITPTPSVIPPNPPNPPIPTGEVIVTDVDTSVRWEQLTPIDIFDSNHKIYPGFKGDYKFKLENSRQKDIKFTMRILEITNASSPNKLPLKYRLKLTGGNYVVGDSSTWLSATELVVEETILQRTSTQGYTLEWYWDPSNDVLDTSIGTHAILDHKFEIHIKAEERN